MYTTGDIAMSRCSIKNYITESPVCYTSYVFFDDASKLTDDLWMVPFEPRGVKYARCIEVISQIGGGFVMILLGVVIFLLQSWVCAGLTGFILFRKWHPYAVLGRLGNIVTLFGVYLLAKYARKETKKIRFSLLFSIFFMISSAILYVLFNLPFYGA